MIRSVIALEHRTMQLRQYKVVRHGSLTGSGANNIIVRHFTSLILVSRLRRIASLLHIPLTVVLQADITTLTRMIALIGEDEIRLARHHQGSLVTIVCEDARWVNVRPH